MEPRQDLIPHLFRTEFRKIVSVLTKHFGLSHVEVAEDIASETFLLAAETWGKKGIPENPSAWLYTVSKNKTKDYLKHHKVFTEKVSPQLQSWEATTEMEVDLSESNITDSQLQMIFAICHPAIPMEAQIGLALRILCGLGIEEIADAFLDSKDTINKRLFRAKEKLREQNVRMEMPDAAAIDGRLEAVLRTLYLLFNEGYCSATAKSALRRELCLEAMRLTMMLVQNPTTDKPKVSALLSLMCFHASRFDARLDPDGHAILYADQDPAQWDMELVQQGEFFLNRSAVGDSLSKFHLEAAIAYWHTQKDDGPRKWNEILQLYNHLLQLEYSPIAALNRTYALARAVDVRQAIAEANKLALQDHHLYHALLGHLLADIDTTAAKRHFLQAHQLAKTEHDRQLITTKIVQLGGD